jgi:hypothetical protein
MRFNVENEDYAATVGAAQKADEFTFLWRFHSSFGFAALIFVAFSPKPRA